MKIDTETKSALEILHRVLEEEGIQACLVGAIVPYLCLALPLGLTIRETADIDSVVRVQSWEQFERLKKRLVECGFSFGREPHRMLYGEHTIIDLLPYGPRLIKNGHLIWGESGKSMNVAGFRMLFSHAKPQTIAPEMEWLVAPLPLFVILKILCYEDRFYPRDLADIIFCLIHYEEDIENSRRFELVGNVSGLNWDVAGAYLLGTESKKFIEPSISIVVRAFLNRFVSPEVPEIDIALRELGTVLPEDSDREQIYLLFEWFSKGLKCK